MPIVQISRIQHRKGLLEDLPQLSSAELAWAVDEQRLFIGNGSLSEGAPYLGNTELLTEHSDLLQSASPYTFKGNSVLQAARTSVTGSDVTRSLQDRLDDYVSIRAYNVDGNNTECNAPISFALSELYGRGFDPQTRIGLYIPAGEYLINEPVEIPPYAFIFGDGRGRTIIYNNTASKSVFKTVDTAGNSGTSMGTDLVSGDGEVLPTGITVQGITFEQRQGADLSEIKSTSDINFIDCEFKGTYTVMTGTSSQTAFAFDSTTAAPSKRVKFHLCTFKNLGYSINQAKLLSGGISFSQCDFIDLYKGIVSGATSGEFSDPIIVQGCVFSGISAQVLTTSGGAKIISTGNQYINCGNRGTGASVTPIMSFGSDGSISWADQFDRPTSASVARIELTSSATKYAYIDPSDRFSWGHVDQLTTLKQTLADNSSGSLTNFSLNPSNNKQAELMYSITRGGVSRSGKLTLAVIASVASLSDNYTFTGSADVGVTFSLTNTGSSATINWATTSTGNSATITILPVTIREL
jgi:hypothetical protein